MPLAATHIRLDLHAGVTLAIAAGNPGAPVLHRIDGVGSAAEALQIDLDNSQGGLFAGAAPGSKRQQAGGGAGAQVLGVPAQAVIAVKSGSKRAAPTQDEDEDMDVVAPAVPDVSLAVCMFHVKREAHGTLGVPSCSAPAVVDSQAVRFARCGMPAGRRH